MPNNLIGNRSYCLCFANDTVIWAHFVYFEVLLFEIFFFSNFEMWERKNISKYFWKPQNCYRRKQETKVVFLGLSLIKPHYMIISPLLKYLIQKGITTQRTNTGNLLDIWGLLFHTDLWIHNRPIKNHSAFNFNIWH